MKHYESFNFIFHTRYKLHVFRSISFHRPQEKFLLSGGKMIFHEPYLVASITASLKTSNSF